MTGYVLSKKDRLGKQGDGAVLCVRDQLKCISLCLEVDKEQVKSLHVRIKR